VLPGGAFDVVVVVEVAGLGDFGPVRLAAVGAFQEAVVAEAGLGVGEDEQDLGRFGAGGLEGVGGVGRDVKEVALVELDELLPGEDAE
jgi:hypothetical protein